MSIDGEEVAGIGDDPDGAVQLQIALEQRPDVARRHSDAMGIVSGEVGRHQVVGDQPRLALAGARAAPENDRPSVQRRRRNEVLSHVCYASTSPPR